MELLEELVSSYAGTLLLVSHDRAFMDNVIGSSLAFEGGGKVREYVGGYHDWLRQGGAFNDQAVAETKTVEAKAQSPVQQQKKSKLSFKLERELGQLPAKIEKLEQQKTVLENEMASENFYQQEQHIVSSQLEKLAAVSSELESCYERWVELSD
jgi:ATP-binding cassette subfamily F protein uup